MALSSANQSEYLHIMRLQTVIPTIGHKTDDLLSQYCTLTFLCEQIFTYSIDGLSGVAIAASFRSPKWISSTVKIFSYQSSHPSTKKSHTKFWS